MVQHQIVPACKKIKKKRINSIDALNIFAISESVNYFLENMKDALFFNLV
jgi:hypothetical protein